MVLLNDEGNRAQMKYGAYCQDLALPTDNEGEYLRAKKLPCQVKITVVRPLTGVNKSRIEDI